MKNRTTWISSLALLVTFIGFSSGCSTSGGKQEPALNHESANRDLKGSVADVSRHAQDVFKDMGISVTGTETKDSGKEMDLTGKAGGKTVAVQVKDIGEGMSHVEVTAREGAFQWSEDYANTVLSKLIAKS